MTMNKCINQIKIITQMNNDMYYNWADLRIDNRRQGPFRWRCTKLGTIICHLRYNSFIIYLLMP